MKRFFSFLILCMLSMTLVLPAFATDDVRTGNAVGGENSTSSVTTSGNYGDNVRDTVNSITNEIAPNVTTEDLIDRLENKGNDVVSIMQTVGKYVCFGAFIVCCIITLVGIIGNKKLLVGGILGLIISGVAYAGIVCGREIVNWIAAWAAS